MLGRPWAQATSARCRGLIEAASGNLSDALTALESALVAHESLPMPFEHARTLLTLRQVQRRAKQKRAARLSLEQALEGFERLGCIPWADRARSNSPVSAAAVRRRGISLHLMTRVVRY